MRLTYKYRLLPTKRQQTILNETLKECCWLYNHFLEERKNLWEQEKKSTNHYSQINQLPSLKEDRPSLKNVYAQVLQEVSTRVDLAFKAFFRRVKNKEKAGYPRFKGIGWYDSFTYPQSGFKITDNGLMLSKIGTIKIKKHRHINGDIKTLTIRRQRNKWYACFSCEIEDKEIVKPEKAIGIDVGIKSFATLSTGEQIENPRFFETEQKALAKAQRKLSKQEKGTPERRKARKVVARIHERIANRRNNFCHQISSKLVKLFDIVCIEDLNINQMKENGCKAINRSIGDVAWRQFFNYLCYKAVKAGKQIVKVNPAYTSQTCSNCGYREAKKLSDRTHRCHCCGFELDRDHNAALNILRLGTQSLGIQSIEASA